MKVYKYVPIADFLFVSKKTSHQESIRYYQDKLNEEAGQGWFFKGTELTVSDYSPGCFNEILLNIPIIGSFVRGAESVETKLLVFEKQANSAEEFTALSLEVSRKNAEMLSKTPIDTNTSASFSGISPEMKKLSVVAALSILALIIIYFIINSIIGAFKRDSKAGGRKSSDYSYGRSDSAKFGKVNEPEGIRMRSGPGVNKPKIGFLDYGTRFKVLNTDGPSDYQNNASGNWYKIEYNGQEGWVFGAFVDLE